jgi:hypothetical protein
MRNTSNNNSDENESEISQYEKVEKCLRLEHLNKEEKDHVKTLVKLHENLFKLPDEPLTLTNKITHKINTTDNNPINVKQYRFPPIHKKEIDKQINDLINEKIITKSDLSHNSRRFSLFRGVRGKILYLRVLPQPPKIRSRARRGPTGGASGILRGHNSVKSW